MSFRFDAADGASFRINAWNWRVILAAVEDAAVFDTETTEVLGYNAHVPLSEGDVQKLLTVLEALRLRMGEGARLMLDGSRRDEPDDGPKPIELG
jgi:hypothetical protein